MIKENKGITLISLVITIVVLMIVAGISIRETVKGVSDTKESVLISELEKVQHAILERYTKYKLTKDEDLLVGTDVSQEALDAEEPSWKLTQVEIGTDVEKKYKELSSSDLKKLGLESGESEEDTYIVNYYTGEVYNSTVQKTKSGELLYRSLQ